MEKPEPKHQAEFVPSGYLAFTWDMLTPDLLFSFGSPSIEGLNSSIELGGRWVGGCCVLRCDCRERASSFKGRCRRRLSARAQYQ